MTAILELTSTEKVRAAWGTTVSELPDDMLEALELADRLTVELAQLGVDYLAVKSAAIASDATAEEKLLLTRLRLFATAFCAYHATSAVRLAVPMKSSDGNNAFTRFAGSALEDTVAEVAALYESTRQAFFLAAGLEITTTSVPFAVAAVPAVDVVTGE